MYPKASPCETEAATPAADSPSRRVDDDARTLLAAIVEGSFDAILGTDLGGTITSWNTSAEAIFGWPAAAVIGGPVNRLIPVDRGGEEEAILERVRRGERVSPLDTLLLHRDGRLIEVSLAVSPVRNAQALVVGASAIVRDTTIARQHEREIARMSRLYAALSQVNQAIMWKAGRDDLFARVCRALVDQGGLRMAWIGWIDEATQRIAPVANCGDDLGYLQSIDLFADGRPESRGPTSDACRTGRPGVINDLSSDPGTVPWRPQLARSGFLAGAAFPIRQGGRVRGSLGVYADQTGFFRDKETALLAEAAGNLSFALDDLVREQDRQLAEQALRSEMRFSDSMLQSMPGIVYFYDDSGRFLRWNRNFETVSGRSAAEIAGMHPLDFFMAADRPRVQSRIDQVFSTGEASIEADFIGHDGRALPFLFTGRRLVFQGKTCLVGVGIDISKRKRAEALLRGSEARLVDAQHIAGIGSWDLDLRTGQIAWSDQVYRIFGVDPASFEVSYDRFMAFVHPDDRARLAADQQQVLDGNGRLDVEHRIVLQDGSEKVVHELADLKRDAAGRALTLSGTVHDITARVRLEAERARRHRAEAADHIKSAFLATMSHELRTPLNSIIGFTGIVLQGLAGPLNEEQGKQLGMVRSSARHLLALVNDVLDISKIEAGQLEVAVDPFDLPRSIAKVIALMRPQAEAKGLALQLQLGPGLGRTMNDERRFEQILINLLSNALKFTERGGVIVQAELVAESTTLRLQVSDTGIGIHPDELPALFQPFRQVDSGLARHHEGTGLGLAICRRLAALMGGRIDVESTWGRGSTFSLTLPLKGPPPP